VSLISRQLPKWPGESHDPTNRITVEEFLKLPEEPGKRFELDEGKLAANPSLTFRQSLIRQQIAEHLATS